MQKLIHTILEKLLKLNKKQIAIILLIFVMVVLATFTLNRMAKDNIETGIWVKGHNMNDVDLDTLSKYGITDIFLHSSAVDIYGEKNVSNWIKKANNKNIKVHLWVQCFYDKTWINPINTTTKDFNYPYFNKKIKEIKKLAAIDGVGGIQLDYIRYPGNAYEYNYPNGITSSNAITKFVAMVSEELDDNLTLSVTVMPEKQSIKYYGQDISALSWYADVIIPMTYSGNYNENSEWIKEMSSYFKNTAIWANVCIGIQVYGSDGNQTSLSGKELKENCQAAYNGGADGFALFPWELMENWFDLHNLKS
ncbi:MAG: putative glycoside hydrolase [Methanobrevibacter sp.]|nr:putative glycoside hydrolase [Methanobrevibacter sp.]